MGVVAFCGGKMRRVKELMTPYLNDQFQAMLAH